MEEQLRDEEQIAKVVEEQKNKTTIQSLIDFIMLRGNVNPSLKRRGLYMVSLDREIDFEFIDALICVGIGQGQVRIEDYLQNEGDLDKNIVVVDYSHADEKHVLVKIKRGFVADIQHALRDNISETEKANTILAVNKYGEEVEKAIVEIYNILQIIG